MDTNWENCKFWEQKESGIANMGLCHFYAPRPTIIHPVESPDSMDAIWPRIKNDELCGEWKAKVKVPVDE